MRAAGATVLLTLVLLTGCGGDDAAAPTPSTTTVGLHVAPSNAEYEDGALTTQDGEPGTFGQY